MKKIIFFISFLPFILRGQGISDSQLNIRAGDGISISNGVINNTLSPASAVLDNTITNPSTITDFGGAYIVATGATGAWSGQDNKIASSSNGGTTWSFVVANNLEKRQVLSGANAGKTYQFNGSAWGEVATPSSTAFYLQNSTSDAGNNKTSTIYRNGGLLLATGGSAQKTALKDFHVQVGGTSGLTSSFGGGMLFSSSAGAGARLYLEHTTAPSGQRVSAIVNENGITYFGAIPTDSGNLWQFSAPLTLKHSNGFVGLNTNFPTERLTVLGAVKISNGGYSTVTNGATTPVPNGGSGTIIFNGTNFFGWNGTAWKQLDN